MDTGSARAARASAWSGGFRYFDQAVVEGGGAAQVGGALGGDLVGIAAVGRELLPPYRERDHQAAPRLAVDARHRGEGAAVVENAHRIAVADAARGCVGGVHLQLGRAVVVAEARQVGEARIEEVAARR